VYQTVLFRHLVRGILIPVIILLTPLTGWAGVWQQSTTARFSEEYDTNPTMASFNSREGVRRTVLVPSYTISNTSDQSELKAGITIQMERSSNQNLSQNRNDPSVFTGFHHQGETIDFSLTAKYDEAATRNSLIDNAGQNFNDSTRRARTFDVNLSNALDQFTTISLDSTYEVVSYKGGSFVDFSNLTVGGRLSRALTERTTLFMRVSGVKYRPVSGVSSGDTSNAILGWDWIYSEQLHGSFQAGKSWSENIGTGNQGTATVSYSGQFNEIALNASRQIVPSGLGNLVRIDQANGSWIYAYSEYVRFGIEAGWQKSHLSANTFYRTSGAWLEQEMNQHWVARMYYQHRNSDQVGISKAYSHMVGVAFTFTHADY